MRVLDLIIKEVHFLNIINGNKKIETREIRPRSLVKYCALDSEGIVQGPRIYDAIQFYAGYHTNRKGALVKVASAEVVILTDEETNEDIVYLEGGQEYIACEIEYTLAEVISKTNC